MRYLVVLLGLAAGCSSAWVKPGGTDTAFQRDRYECEKDATALQSRWEASFMIERCLQTKGWAKQ